MQKNTCCFIGHRIINETEELKTRLYETIERLIKEEKIDTFLFGSKSRFDDLCLEAATPKSGTKTALDYATKHQKQIIVL